MPSRRIICCARRKRCERSAAEIGGGIGIDGVSAAAWAKTLPTGKVIAAARAAPPPSIARRLMRLWIILAPSAGAGVAQEGRIRQQRPMFDPALHDTAKRLP